MLQLAGLENQVIYLILEDHQIINDTMLDSINSLLSSGEVICIIKLYIML